jgi:hypothetical protein
MRPVMQTTYASRASISTPPPRKRHSSRWASIAALLIIIVMMVFYFSTSHAASTKNAIRSGYSGACLDSYHSGTIAGTPIDTASCNDTPAQNWVTTDTTIKQLGTTSCVTADSSGVVTLRGCDDGAGQVWLRDQDGYFNPDSGKCLGSAVTGEQLKLSSCNNMSWQGVVWTPDTDAQAPVCGGSQGEVIACNAIKEWTAWEANGSNHESLLTSYTDGTPSEEWCADFVSYVYKESGYPFTNGSADGWDEDDANQIQYMGFTVHQAGDGYAPKPGDVAFFNYPGGHVEVVVSGGSKPTFVYGDSAQIDPTTGNGQMKANTITGESDEGQIMYYLTPSA